MAEYMNLRMFIVFNKLPFSSHSRTLNIRFEPSKMREAREENEKLPQGIVC